MKEVKGIRLQGYDSLWHEWLSQMYGVPVALISRMTGMRTDRVYRMIKRWHLTEMCRVARVDYNMPGPWRRSSYDAPDAENSGPLWVWPDRESAWGMLDFDPGDWEPKASTAAHLTAVAHLRYAINGLNTDPDIWTSERILRRRMEPGSHIHDGWLLDEHDRDQIWGIEVELSRKREKGRLVATMAAALDSADQHDLAGVLYYVRGADLRRAVQRAAQTLARERGQIQLSNLHVHDLDVILAGHEVP
ncbi:hypothetical protein [Nocardia seriolae]|uniref:IclR family transcriptional regulator n=1 Tax=Nocardia seriolae TaxID=37332 RepID=A0A0B8NG15_9NOCA|nr:hypothetical protein [Nocardia seriolae]APA94203.1 hypothetical protein NS506_00116 [Nocardia seriolae]MTJ60568.1 hypothetical protein [Nocardia seriolae]MTJ72201.1 hypothetical protein [Nocardia seriolae]MTJ84548.1 hypothetical protein [Nocardia seriolae]MTK28536.1 hypothetical protein [Nocardia seriolae]